MLSFYIPWKSQKTFGFLMFLRGIKWERWRYQNHTRTRPKSFKFKQNLGSYLWPYQASITKAFSRKELPAFSLDLLMTGIL